MNGEDAEALAIEAGLRYVHDDEIGSRRIRRGKGFSHVDRNGAPVDDDRRGWIESLAIPPAWNDVWICGDDSGHILATGTDRAGRKQYIYHPIWQEVRDEVKFERMGEFGRRLHRLRRAVDTDLRRRELPRAKVVALAVAVLDRTLIRVGHRRYAEENGAHGLTTLTPEHVAVEGHHVHLEFEGKGGGEHILAFRDRRLANLIACCQELSGQTLFSYESPAGPAAIASGDVNDYLAATMGSRFTAKDFRTWGASATVVSELVGNGGADALLVAIDAAAERLGNTRSVLRDSYLHPAVAAAYRAGHLSEAWRRSRRGRWLDRSESTLNRVVERFAGDGAGVGSHGTGRDREEDPMPKDRRPSVKDEERYEAIRREGASKEKAARIANTPAKTAGKRGGKSPRYEEWSKDELYDKARQVGIEGRSKMDKSELISALRNH